MTTFTDLLGSTLARDPGRPLVTFYDDATGERVELSATTYANWVAKVSGLLTEELDLERGQRLRLDLPSHWLVPVLLGAAWTVGLVVTDDEDPDAVVCGPDTLSVWAARADDLVVLACALRPMGVRFADAVPAGVHDVGVEVWSQPDAFTSYDPPTSGSPAVALGGTVLTQGELWDLAAAGDLLVDGGRLGTTANPATPEGLSTWTQPVARGGSVVLVTGASSERLETTYADERVTSRFPG